MVNKASSINGDGGPNQQQNVTDSQPAQFSIKPIKTTDDTGEPGLSVAKDLTRVLDLIDDERHLVAHELYEDIKARMQEMEEKIQKHGQEHQQNHKHKKKATHHGKQKSKGGWLSSGSKTKIANKSSASCDEEDFRKAKEFLHINKEALDLLDVSLLVSSCYFFCYTIHICILLTSFEIFKFSSESKPSHDKSETSAAFSEG
mgnify:CR=1 FL=1